MQSNSSWFNSFLLPLSGCSTSEKFRFFQHWWAARGILVKSNP